MATKKHISVNLALRNVGEFEKVSMSVFFDVELAPRPKVNFTIKDGLVLSEGDKKCEFSGSYEIIIDPFNKIFTS